MSREKQKTFRRERNNTEVIFPFILPHERILNDLGSNQPAHHLFKNGFVHKSHSF